MRVIFSLVLVTGIYDTVSLYAIHVAARSYIMSTLSGTTNPYEGSSFKSYEAKDDS